MRTTCYIQLGPKYNRHGAVVGMKAQAISQNMPRAIRDGAFLVALVLTIPDNALKPTIVHVDIPLEKLAKEVTATIP